MESLLALCQTLVRACEDDLRRELAEKAAELALLNGLDLSQPSNLSVGSANPLFEACRTGNMHMVKLFISNGASLDILDAEGRSPLYVAISGYHNNKENILQLLRWGADVNLHKQGRCPLLAAFYSMNNETAKLLINHGADVNSVVLPAFCFVESVFSLNSNLVMMASGVRFDLEDFQDLISLASTIVGAGLKPRTFYLSARRFLVEGFTATELAGLWSFQHLCLILGFRVDSISLQVAIEELRKTLKLETNPRRVHLIKDRLDKLCWTEAFQRGPLPLTYLARMSIRQHLVSPQISRSKHVNNSIAALPLPNLCKDFLNLKNCNIHGIFHYMK